MPIWGLTGELSDCTAFIINHYVTQSPQHTSHGTNRTSIYLFLSFKLFAKQQARYLVFLEERNNVLDISYCLLAVDTAFGK